MNGQLRALRATLVAALEQVDALLGGSEQAAETGVCPKCGSQDLERIGTFGDAPVQYLCHGCAETIQEVKP